MKYDIVMTKFEEYCIPRKNWTLTQYKFLTSRQDETENFNEFENNLKRWVMSVN